MSSDSSVKMCVSLCASEKFAGYGRFDRSFSILREERPSEAFRIQQVCSREFLFRVQEEETRFDSVEEKASWQPRTEILKWVWNDSQILSVSIIPKVKFTPQTVYCTKHFIDKSPHNPLPSYIDPKFTYTQETSVFSREEADESSPVLKGFFKPYPSFSSRLAVAQFDPKELPANILKVPYLKFEVLEGCLESKLCEKVEQVAMQFYADEHAEGMGLRVLQYEMPKVFILYFTKPSLGSSSRTDSVDTE